MSTPTPRHILIHTGELMKGIEHERGLNNHAWVIVDKHSGHGPGCLWIDTKEALKYLLNLQKQMDNLLDWPQQKCEEALKKSTQAYTACFCDINSEKIADFRKKLNHVIKDVHPEWQGKKICYKSDEYTSHNVSDLSNRF